MDHLVYIFILTWIIHQYITSKKEIFSVCLQASACCSPSCHYVCVYVCVCDHVYTNSQCCMASLWGTSKSLITDFSISFKANQSVKSLSSSNICMIRLGQECLWSHCATLPVISPSLSRVYFWLLYAPRRRKKKGGQNYLALHLFRYTSNQSPDAVHVTVPKVTKRNEKSLCTAQSIPINMPHSLWSLTPLLRKKVQVC